jgi:hypothetical protein
LQPFLAVVIYFDIVASAKFYCNEISGVEAKIVFKCNAYFLLQYTLIIATNLKLKKSMERKELGTHIKIKKCSPQDSNHGALVQIKPSPPLRYVGVFVVTQVLIYLI